MKATFQDVLLTPSQSLVGVQREWHTRTKGVYIVVDRHGKFILCSQRLPLIAGFVNGMANDCSDKVSVSGLHQIVGTTQNRVCGWTKNRWKLQFCKLEDCAEYFERERVGFEQALILGTPSAYQISLK